MESLEQRHPLVLIVDDDDAIQRSLGRLLRLHGFAPVSAMTIGGAVTAAEEQPLDAVILDLSLSGRESGLDFLAWLRRHPEYVRVPILILTGQTLLGEDDEALIRRHRAYVFYKPQPIHVLVEYLTRLVGGSGPGGTVDSPLQRLAPMDAKPTPVPLTAEGERPTEEICPACRKTGLVYVIPFRWGGERHLNWCCRSCGHAWAMAERRIDDRR